MGKIYYFSFTIFKMAAIMDNIFEKFLCGLKDFIEKYYGVNFQEKIKSSFWDISVLNSGLQNPGLHFTHF